MGHALLMLARECGIHTAQSRLVTIGDRDALLIKRFDRGETQTGYQRARMLSALAEAAAAWSHPLRPSPPSAAG